ncbi:MAG TPA: Ig-like domain-containing protein [Stellaceae bacterium]|nr:Ig-like domain-containing protein [Stellaceae bacterium]
MQRNFWIVAAVVAIVAAVAVGMLVPRKSEAPAPAAVASHEEAQKPPAPPPPATTAPSFDAFRVGPDGTAVIAGRAEPGANVTVLDNGKPVGQVTADANGQWVLLPHDPLAPGAQQLSLSATAPGTSVAQNSANSLAVVVPDHPTAAPPVAVLLPQGQGQAKALGTQGAGRLVLDMVEYDANGHTIPSGSAAAGTTVTIFVNDHQVATATAAPDGTWSSDLGDGIPVGRYLLRLVDGGDEVALELHRAAPGELAAGDYFAVIPGNTLWHFAQRAYGNGLRYVEIYRANPGRIGNPDLIYPGQLLARPAKTAEH